MRKASIMNNLKCKMQAHVRVCEENNIEKKPLLRMPIEIILWLKIEFEGSYRKSGETYQDNILKDDSP